MFDVYLDHNRVTSIHTSRVQPPYSASTSEASAEPTSSNTTQQTSANWWPAGSGVRPKYTSTVSRPETTDSVKERKSSCSTSSDVDEGMSAVYYIHCVCGDRTTASTLSDVDEGVSAVLLHTLCL